MVGRISKSGGGLERFRRGLLLLAETRIDDRLRRYFEPDDVVQETLKEAFEKRNQLRGDSDAELAGWLRQILKNKIADAIRFHTAGKRDISRVQAQIDDSFSRLQTLIPASQTSPSQGAIRAEEMISLPQALDELLKPQREAIVLHYLQGRTLAEAATALGRSEPAVAGLLYRGLKKLHQLLESMEGG